MIPLQKPYARHASIQVDDDAPDTCTVREAVAANADDPDLAFDLCTLRMGETIVRGGGAAPIVTITGVDDETPAEFRARLDAWYAERDAVTDRANADFDKSFRAALKKADRVE